MASLLGDGITRRHWVPDEEVSACQYKSCGKRFSMIERKHHCRRCGKIFCAKHAERYIPLTPDAKPALREEGVQGRVCNGCYVEYANAKRDLHFAFQ